MSKDDIIKFLRGTDFMRLGMAIDHGDTNAAMMIISGMQRESTRLGLDDSFAMNFSGIRNCIIGGDKKQAQDILALVTAKRIVLEKQFQEDCNDQKNYPH